MIEDRCVAALLGLACGDALGAPAEFRSQEDVRARWGRLTEMVGGGLWAAWRTRPTPYRRRVTVSWSGRRLPRMWAARSGRSSRRIGATGPRRLATRHRRGRGRPPGT